MEDLIQCDYGSALIPKDITICGVTLKPFCLGHLMLLDELKNPFVNAEQIEVNKHEAYYRLHEAIIVCGCTFEQGLELVRDKTKWEKEYKRFDKNLIENMKAEPNWNFFQKKALFNNYLMYYLQSMPTYSILQQNKDMLGSGTDWKTAIAVIFKKMNYSKKEFLNMNMRLLFHEWTADAEAEGTIKVFDKYTAQRDKDAQQKKALETILTNE